MSSEPRKTLISLEDDLVEFNKFVLPLEKLGWQVKHVPSLSKASSLIKDGLDVEVALIDLQWRNDSGNRADEWAGFDFVRSLNARNIFPAIVVLSNYSELKYVLRAFQLGSLDFVEKGMSDEADPHHANFLDKRCRAAMRRQQLKRLRHSRLVQANTTSGTKDVIGHLLIEVVDWLGDSNTHAYVALETQLGMIVVASRVSTDLPLREDVSYDRDETASWLTTQGLGNVAGILESDQFYATQQEISSNEGVLHPNLRNRLVIPIKFQRRVDNTVLNKVGAIVVERSKPFNHDDFQFLSEVADFLTYLLLLSSVSD